MPEQARSAERPSERSERLDRIVMHLLTNGLTHILIESNEISYKLITDGFR